MTTIELRHLITLRAIDEHESLQDAAAALGVTQSALSHQIRDLEKKLGVSLLNRRRRPATLTTAGLRLLTLAHEVLPLVTQTERELQKLARGESGRLYIAIDCHSCFDWLMPTLNRFRQDYPEITLDLSASFSFNPLPALSRGDLDLVITSDPDRSLPQISYEPLFRYELVLAVGHRHRLAGQKFIKPAALADETLITYPVESSRLDIFTEFLDPAGIEPAHIRHNELTPIIIQLVSSHRGVAALPSWALQQALAQDWLTICHLDKAPGIWMTLYAAMREEDSQAPFMQNFIRLAKETSFKHLSGIRRV